MKNSKGAKKKNKGADANIITTKIPAPNRGIVVRTKSTMPKMATIADSMVLSNSEILTPVAMASSSAYTPQRVFIAPYQTAFLSGIGLNFQRYRFEMLRFVYIPSVANNASGSMYMSYGTDHRDAAPANANLQMVSSGAITAPVWAGFDGGSALTHVGNINNAITLDFPVHLRAGFQYAMATGSGFVALPAADKNDNSPGYLDLGTDGGAFTGTVGKVYMVYKVRFWCPISTTQQT